ncbi:glycosyltransferase family 4 protein [Acetanaerobacterium elongatum]|nr:glycosyltransferase family 4 protein [Acetanaerobacterium elongatum]
MFISYVDFDDRRSGSSVRPQKMYNAFLKLGSKVFLVTGAQNNRKKRRKTVLAALEQLKTLKPKFCYIELPSGPIFNMADRLLILRLHRMGVPIAAFYRDAFYKFAAWWQVSPHKKAVINLLHKIDNRLLARCCSMVYFPSQSMADLFSFPQKGVLPPAGEARFLPVRKQARTCIYVGGLSKRYGTDILLKAFEQLNRTGSFPLIIICREAEKKEIAARYLSMPWLTVAHAAEAQLKQYYTRADIGLYCGRRDVYMDFAIPVKVFEYLSYGLPVVTTNCTEIAAFVRRSDVGVIVEDNAAAIADGVSQLIENPQKYQKLCANAVLAINSENLWEHRAAKVLTDLSSFVNPAAKRKTNQKE